MNSAVSIDWSPAALSTYRAATVSEWIRSICSARPELRGQDDVCARALAFSGMAGDVAHWSICQALAQKAHDIARLHTVSAHFSENECEVARHRRTAALYAHTAIELYRVASVIGAPPHFSESSTPAEQQARAQQLDELASYLKQPT